jgi:hypothetical protein
MNQRVIAYIDQLKSIHARKEVTHTFTPRSAVSRGTNEPKVPGVGPGMKRRKLLESRK